MVLGLPEGMPISATTVCHLPCCIFDLQIREDQTAGPFCDAPRKVLPSAQSTQPLRTRAARLSGSGFAEIEIERVELGHSGVVVVEGVGVSDGQASARRAVASAIPLSTACSG